MQSKWKNSRDRYLLHLKKRCFRYIMLFTYVLGNKYTKKHFTTFKILRNLSCLFSLFPRILSAAVGFLVYKWNSYHPKVSSLLCLFTFILVVILSVWNKIGVPSDRLLFWIRRKRLVWRNKSFQLCQLQCEINYFFYNHTLEKFVMNRAWIQNRRLETSILCFLPLLNRNFPNLRNRSYAEFPSV